MNATNLWGAQESFELRDNPEYELEALLLDVNERIVQRMNEIGWRKSDLAKALGVSRPFVTKLLDGNANLTMKSLIKVANVLGMKVLLDMMPRELAALYDESDFDPVGFDATPSFSGELGDKSEWSILTAA